MNQFSIEYKPVMIDQLKPSEEQNLNRLKNNSAHQRDPCSSFDPNVNLQNQAIIINEQLQRSANQVNPKSQQISILNIRVKYQRTKRQQGDDQLELSGGQTVWNIKQDFATKNKIKFKKWTSAQIKLLSKISNQVRKIEGKTEKSKYKTFKEIESLYNKRSPRKRTITELKKIDGLINKKFKNCQNDDLVQKINQEIKKRRLLAYSDSDSDQEQDLDQIEDSYEVKNENPGNIDKKVLEKLQNQRQKQLGKGKRHFKVRYDQKMMKSFLMLQRYLLAKQILGKNQERYQNGESKEKINKYDQNFKDNQNQLDLNQCMPEIGNPSIQFQIIYRGPFNVAKALQKEVKGENQE